ncbi:hypothetical protein F5144DRAFT_284871 [Chaetomium tenue]|uniref:Uncharacterized protein n=1 Tax=Chaetomium tenue TaxID=1854479 RepID=A0ACB7P3K4_9PEZI|nr:hypothetical protein F5144DRAFT_284871 [Chaetomium globosum]
MRTFLFLLGSGAAGKFAVCDNTIMASGTAFISSTHLLPPFFDRQGATTASSSFFRPLLPASRRTLATYIAIVVAGRNNVCLVLSRTEKLSGQWDLLEGKRITTLLVLSHLTKATSGNV